MFGKLNCASKWAEGQERAPAVGAERRTGVQCACDEALWHKSAHSQGRLLREAGEARPSTSCPQKVLSFIP